jgi:hypothetical protein
VNDGTVFGFASVIGLILLSSAFVNAYPGNPTNGHMSQIQRLSGHRFMNLYVVALVTHVLVAILGLGSVVSVAMMAATVRRTGRGVTEVSTWIRPLLRLSAFSLAGMLVTGVIMIFVAGGGFHRAWWLRLSVLLLVVTGALHARARRALKTEPASEHDARLAIQRVERIAYAMSLLIATITVLMELKPF